MLRLVIDVVVLVSHISSSEVRLWSQNQTYEYTAVHIPVSMYILHTSIIETHAFAAMQTREREVGGSMLPLLFLVLLKTQKHKYWLFLLKTQVLAVLLYVRRIICRSRPVAPPPECMPPKTRESR